MVADMQITEALSQRVRDALAVTGWSWEEVKRRGGPSSTTMTAIKAGRVDKTIDARTLRKVDTAFGWPAGTARSLVDPTFTPSGDVTDDAPVSSVAVSDPGTMVPLNVVRAKAAAVGVEFEATYTDAADRERALSDITAALAAIMRTGELGGSGSAAHLLEADE